MANLSYKTRGNSSPQGKERVYFTCHPADFKAFFEPICEDIFQTQNCAIWYRAELESDTGAAGETEAEKKTSTEPNRTVLEEDLALDLGQMQLFVIPITSRFLYQANRAREVEFKFALEHHIPILPLMQEQGLENEFNRICGDLQFLDKQAGVKDPTALPYDEKLKKFLESVLLGDDLAAKVRAAFDAYIFLSYRKKDRKYAQKLMRLIHKNPFCRDIAIWYDEFLTPGENFNDAIRNAMEKSSLFAMVVTPNLVNEVNYVMTTEYPKAAETGMPILPAQMVETDREALAKAYPGIDGNHVTDARDESALREALAGALSDGRAYPSMEPGDTAAGKFPETALKRIHKIALAETDRKEAPQHLFFIGLAYLGGVDVETDTQRATELITRAADAGLEEAIEKLVSMCRNGEGCKRDYLAAVQWQEKLAELRRLAYETDGTQAKGEKYLSALRKLYDYVWEMRNVSKTEDICQIRLKIAGEMVEQFGGEENLRDLCQACSDYADFLKAEGKLEQAEKYYEEFMLHSERLVEKSNTAENRQYLSLAYERMGEIAGNLQRAREYFKKYLSMMEEFVRDTGTAGSRLGVSIAYIKIGGICRANGDLQGALEYYEAALKINRELTEETNRVDTYQWLEITYQCIGDIFLSEGKLQKAEENFENCVHISRNLAEEIDTVENHRELSVSYGKLGDICRKKEELWKAKEYYEKGLHIDEKLAEETGTVESRRDLSVSYCKLGDTCEAGKNHRMAREYYEKCLRISEELARETGGAWGHWDEVTFRARIGLTYEAEGDLDAAYEYFDRALDIRKKLTENTESVEDQFELACAFSDVGRICHDKGDLQKAREYYGSALKIRESLADKTDSLESLSNLCASYDNLGTVCKEEGDFRAARDYFQEGLRICTKLVEETGTAENRYLESVFRERLGEICKKEGNLLVAYRHYKEVLSIREELSYETESVASYEALGRAYSALFQLDPSNLDYTMLMQAAIIWKQLSVRCPWNTEYANYLGISRELLRRIGLRI